MSDKPKVTIGLMLHNEVAYVAETIQSIQKQQYDDYELLVGDNASDDGSSSIVEKFAAADPRIIHIKRDRNIGALQNWNDILERARGDYFVLAGGHDLWSHGYLIALATELDNNENAVLTFAKTQWIDVEGKELHIPTSVVDTSGMPRLSKFIALMVASQHYLYGMMRTDCVRNTRKQLEILGSGEIFLQELAQLGDFVLVEGQRWFRRKSRKEEYTLERLSRYRQVLFSSRRTKKRFKYFPHMQMLLVYLGLPFVLKNVPIKIRLAMIFTYPIIYARFLKPFFWDLAWLLKR